MTTINVLELNIKVYNNKEDISGYVSDALKCLEHAGKEYILVKGGEMNRPSLSAFTRAIQSLGLEYFGLQCSNYKDALAVARSVNGCYVRLSGENPLGLLKEASDLRSKMGIDYIDLYADFSMKDIDRMNMGIMHRFIDPKNYFRRNDVAVMQCKGMQAEEARICLDLLKSLVSPSRVYIAGIEKHLEDSNVTEKADGVILG